MRIPTHPLIYEINTWPWLTSLSRRYGRSLTLASLPAEVYDELAAWGFDAIWLMGVWERSLAGRAQALRAPMLEDYRRALPDLEPQDVVGSPYAIHGYVVDAHLGGPEALAQCRAELARRGMGLFLDYVPNHVAFDHPWLTTDPDALLHGDAAALAADPVTFFQGPRGDVVAHGRDPYFPAWSDTAQINAFSSTARNLGRATLEALASQCDGVRCDMAMLLLNRIFSATWGRFAGPAPETEFWTEVIPPVKAAFPDFLFLAEVYWQMEAEVQAVGFDYTYDKDYYDALHEGNLDAARWMLSRPQAQQARMVHFVENHDEARAVTAFGPERSLAAAAASLLVPGARLLYEGQMAGWRVKTPVQLGRYLEEATDPQIEAAYRALLGEARQAIYRDGVFIPFAAIDRESLVFCWTLEDDWRLVVVSFASAPKQVAFVLPDNLLHIGQVPARDVVSSSEAILGREGVANAALDPTLPAFGVQIWRPR